MSPLSSTRADCASQMDTRVPVAYGRADARGMPSGCDPRWPMLSSPSCHILLYMLALRSYDSPCYLRASRSHCYIALITLQHLFIAFIRISSLFFQPTVHYHAALPSKCAIKLSKDTPFVDACTTSIPSTHAPYMVSGGMQYKRRRYLLATPVVCIAAIGRKSPILPVYCQILDTEVAHFHRHFKIAAPLCHRRSFTCHLYQRRSLDHFMSTGHDSGSGTTTS